MRAAMSTAGIHRGFLKKYGGFMFKQWREKYLVLTLEGSLCVCRDTETPPDQVVALQSNCVSIVEGREILDLPRLPAGGRRDCCFALILQNKFLLLLAESPEDCSLWLKLLRKVREGTASPLALQRQRSIAPCITDRDPLPDTAGSDRVPGSPRAGDITPPPSRLAHRGGSFRESEQTAAGTHRRSLRSVSAAPPPRRVADCLRHGNSSDARAVRAVCLLMGGAAASSALGYLNTCAPASPLATRAPEMVRVSGGGFAELPGGGGGGPGPFHGCSQDVDPPHFNSFDFEADVDFDGFDCGGFAF